MPAANAIPAVASGFSDASLRVLPLYSLILARAIACFSESV